MPIKLPEHEQLRIITGLIASNGVGPDVDMATLAPGRFNPGDPALFVTAVVAGQKPRDLLLLLSPAFRARLSAHNPDAGPPPVSTWADLGAILGPITWAWHPWLPNGFSTALLADQAMGKSILFLRIAACYLLGWPWPDGTPFTGELGKVVWCEAESSQGLNYARAKAWGLPLNQIVSPLGDPLDDVMLDNPEHLQAIENCARQRDMRLVLLDSLTGASLRDPNDARMFHTVKTLADLYRNIGKPGLLSHHTRKLTLLDERGVVTLQQGRGSGAIFQPSRVVWSIDVPDPNDDETRRLALIKNNIVGNRAATPLGFTIGDAGLTFCDAPMKPRREILQDRAADLLRALLRKGPKRATELREEIESAGLSWDAAKRAKKALDIVASRSGGVWFWGLPTHESAQEELL